MLKRLLKWLEETERRWRQSFGDDISTPAARRQAKRHFRWVDHGLLRVWWTNFHGVAPGVYRSNQPSARRLARYRDMGIRSVLNLRGTSPYSYYLFEREACAALGLTLVDLNMSPTELPQLETILTLEKHFRDLPRPMVMHCKSGADRAGFASALYLLLVEDQPIELAQRQLSLKFLHIRSSKKGILDYCLEKYRQTNKASPIGFRDWLVNMYDPEAIGREFNASRNRGEGS